MSRIIASHDMPEYRKMYANSAHQNGAYWYSVEICENIIPLVDTWRPWVTINVRGKCADHAIVFIHNNMNPGLYAWLSEYRDLVLVCGVPSTCEKVAHLGKAIYLPLSIDTEYVSQFGNVPKNVEYAFVGRRGKARGAKFARGTQILANMDRDTLLHNMAKCRKVYAVGRCALEAKCLGAEILPYDERFPDPELWQVIDNRDAAKMLQKELDEIDKENKPCFAFKKNLLKLMRRA